jgi:hypothetical protein
MLLVAGHGEFTDYESDFRGNDPVNKHGSPYWNKYGGPLAYPPERFYSDPQVLRYYKRQLRYIVARWGYSTGIMAWELLNEPDLARFWSNQAPYYGRQNANFVEALIRHIRTHDPARHLVTSGMFSYKAPHALPLLQSDAIDFFAGHVFNPQLTYSLNEDRKHIQKVSGKIFLATEADASPFVIDPGLTYRTMRKAIWGSYVMPYAGAANPWWWVLIDQKGLYDDFAALARFAEGEDRRGRNLENVAANALDANRDRILQAWCLHGKERSYCWVYSPVSFSERFRWTEEHTNPATLSIPTINQGDYLVEVWDTHKGKVIARSEVRAGASGLSVELPPFAQDIACKIIKRRPPEPVPGAEPLVPAPVEPPESDVEPPP